MSLLQHSKILRHTKHHIQQLFEQGRLHFKFSSNFLLTIPQKLSKSTLLCPFSLFLSWWNLILIFHWKHKSLENDFLRRSNWCDLRSTYSTWQTPLIHMRISILLSSLCKMQILLRCKSCHLYSSGEAWNNSGDEQRLQFRFGFLLDFVGSYAIAE